MRLLVGCARGISYERLGQLAEARTDYPQALRLAQPESEVWQRARDRRKALRGSSDE